MSISRPDDAFPDPPSTKMIRLHSGWLSRALRAGRTHPRIPVRRVRDGGFAAMMASPTGRAVARWWWQRALEDGE